VISVVNNAARKSGAVEQPQSRRAKELAPDDIALDKAYYFNLMLASRAFAKGGGPPISIGSSRRL